MSLQESLKRRYQEKLIDLLNEKLELKENCVSWKGGYFIGRLEIINEILEELD